MSGDGFAEVDVGVCGGGVRRGGGGRGGEFDDHEGGRVGGDAEAAEGLCDLVRCCQEVLITRMSLGGTAKAITGGFGVLWELLLMEGRVELEGEREGRAR